MKHNPMILRSMAEDQSAAADGDDSGRKSVAIREWINESGEKVVAGDPTAVGFRYTFRANGESVDYLCGEAGKLPTMLAIMGGLTKVGNIVNSVINADDYDGVANPMDDVREWLALADAGKWREIAEGTTRGPKYDKDVLAAALLQWLGSTAKGDIAHYRERLDDKSYYAKVRANPEVMAGYLAQMAERGNATVSSPEALA